MSKKEASKLIEINRTSKNPVEKTTLRGRMNQYLDTVTSIGSTKDIKALIKKVREEE